MILLKGTFVETPALGHLTIYRDYLLITNEVGTIVHFEESNSQASLERLTGATHSGELVASIPAGSFILPTFCDLHLHAPQFLYQGNGLDLTLFEWLDKYTYKAEERLDSDPGLAKRVYDRLAKRLLENGTGAVSLFGTINAATNKILAQSMLDAGIRARVGKLSMDISTRPTYVEASTEVSLDAVSSFIADCYHPNFQSTSKDGQIALIEPVITPRFVPTCSDELLRGLATLSSAQGVHIQSHLAEGKEQVEWVKSTRRRDDIDVFHDAGLLTSKTLQAHCTFLTPPDLDRIAASGVSVAHCPLSNIYFSMKPFPLREALSMGVKVGLGTDVAGGYSMDIMNAMRNAVAVSRIRESQRLEDEALRAASSPDAPADPPMARQSLAITWIESLYLATKGGAIGLGGKWQTLGEFKVGNPFDAQQIQLFDAEGYGVGALDFFDIDNESSETTDITEAMIEKWWCIGDNRNRSKVWVQGTDRLGT